MSHRLFADDMLTNVLAYYFVVLSYSVKGL